MIEVEVGCIVGVSTEVHLYVIAIEVVPCETSIVGYLATSVQSTAHIVVGRVGGIVHVDEVRGLTTQVVTLCGHVVLVVVTVAHTSHQHEVAGFLRLVGVVGEVLPLIVAGGVLCIGQTKRCITVAEVACQTSWYIFLLYHIADGITQTGCEYKILERGDVCICGAIDTRQFVGNLVGIDTCQRVHAIIHPTQTIVASLTILQGMKSCGNSRLDAGGDVCIGIIYRCQRIGVDDTAHLSSVLNTFRK